MKTETGCGSQSSAMPSNASRSVDQGRPKYEDSGPSGSRPISEISTFAASGPGSREALYEESQAQLDEFKETLAEFAKTLQDDKLNKKLDIKIKSADKYTMNDVVQIATKMEERHQNASTVKTCMGRIRFFFRKAGEEMPLLKQLLKFAPSDTYGTIIVGGLSMILTGIDRARVLREEIAMAVADIPTKLESAQLLLEAHHDSPRIHTLTDSVFLAVFSLLHEIVKELNKRNLAKKALQICFKGSDYGQEVSNAITNLDTKIAAFKEGVAISSAEKLGQIYRLVDLGRTEAQQGFAELRSNNQMIQQTVPDMAHGTVRAEAHQPQSLTASSPDPGMRSHNSARSELEISELIQEMFEGMDLTAPSRDIEESLFSFAKLSTKEKDKVRYIVLSEEVKTLRRGRKTQALLVQPERHPEHIDNPITFAASLMTKGMKAHHTKPIVLSFHGRLRFLGWFPDREKEVSRPQEMLNFINLQLVTQVLQRNGDRKIPLLNDKTQRLRCRKEVSMGIQLFRETLSTLSGEENVFIIIESPPFMMRCQRELEIVLKGLVTAISDTDAVVKFIILNTYRPIIKSVFEDHDCMELYVKHELGGFRGGVLLSKLEQEFSELDVEDERRQHSELQQQSNRGGGFGFNDSEFSDSDSDSDSDDMGSDIDDSDAASGGEDS